jgi:hypothetical protein
VTASSNTAAPKARRSRTQRMGAARFAGAALLEGAQAGNGKSRGITRVTQDVIARRALLARWCNTFSSLSSSG